MDVDDDDLIQPCTCDIKFLVRKTMVHHCICSRHRVVGNSIHLVYLKAPPYLYIFFVIHCRTTD